MSTEFKNEGIQALDSLTATLNMVEVQYRCKLDEYKQYLDTWRWNIPKPVERNGYYLFPGFEFDTAQYAYDEFELGKGDVVVANYSKTGTHWMLEIVWSIFGRKDAELLQKYSSLHYMFTFLEYGPVCKHIVSENLPFKRNVFVTHLPPSLINLKKYRESGVKVIYLIRNPKDQAVSWYNFVKKRPVWKSANWKHIYPQEERRFYDLYIAGKPPLYSKEGEGYLEHVRAWYEHKNDSNLLWLAYEDLKKKPREEIGKLAEFIGEYPTENELDWIVKKTSFISMKKEAENNHLMKTIVRKGEIGDWRNHLSKEQSETIDRKVNEILGDTDIKFTYE